MGIKVRDMAIQAAENCAALVGLKLVTPCIYIGPEPAVVQAKPTFDAHKAAEIIENVILEALAKGEAPDENC